MVLKQAFAFLLAAVWLCACTAQLQSESGLMQDIVPRESKTCAKIRANLENMLYTTYKGSIPRQMLKEILPGLVEPLLPSVCGQSGSYSKWLQKASAASEEPASGRQKRQIGFGLMNVKDPGDRPPPGMTHNPFKDPGDRLAAGAFRLFGITPMKDPGDAIKAAMASGSAGEGAAATESVVNPATAISSMMAMAGMINANRQRAAFAARFNRGRGQPFRNGFYGDSMPSLGRRKRSAEEDKSSTAEIAHLRHKRANGEEDKGGFDAFAFSNFLPFSDRPDHRSASPSMSPLLFLRSLWSSPRQSTRQGGNQQGRSSTSAGANGSPNRQSVFQRGSQPTFRSPSAGVKNIYQQMLRSAARPTQATKSPAPARASGPVFSAPPAQTSPVFSSVPSRLPTSNGQIYGDNLPRYTVAGRTRRVKRATEEESSSSDPSPSDVITFGDVSIPVDTFNNMIAPRGRSKPDDNVHPPPPAYRFYRPPAPPARAYYPPPSPAIYPPQQLTYLPHRGTVRRMGYFPKRQIGFVARPRMAPLPMGAAQPLIYGNAPVFG